MPEIQTHITCCGCGRIRVMTPGTLKPADYSKLKCRHCGARDPKVEEKKVFRPGEPGYTPRRL